MTNSAITPYQERSRFFNVDDAFNVKVSEIPPHIFEDERDAAMQCATDSQEILCDLRGFIGSKGPATAPLMLASYLRLAASKPLVVRHRASTEIYYVIKGAGTTRVHGECIAWSQGDVFLLPGGAEEVHEAISEEGAVLWLCTNEPLLEFENLQPLPFDESPLRPTHYTSKAMREALNEAMTHTRRNGKQARSVMLGTDVTDRGTISPAFTLAFNSIPPNDFQIPHRHNSAAISLVLECSESYSMVDGCKVEWSQYATFLTPAAAMHSHHNPTDNEALLLIVQDGGLYYHCRSMGFSLT
ncbi:cupin domain-containing protein [Candidimonas sp. SYP-B2681]|uniref:cupin domain-containing protein n=1 Tax=Candidimonas sp. SYP-B2681 TaxID=2497686 RepID=UPI000F87C368|nr:cupin domain-containing protein [Candidimonas sp. SYP-B2681]RTZ41552.1 cupin domain-containing protein [Candidimonas sp. SYP-B2681]